MFIPFLSKEAFVEECALLRSDSLSSIQLVEGEYMSEAKMRDEMNWSEILAYLLLDKERFHQ